MPIVTQEDAETEIDSLAGDPKAQLEVSRNFLLSNQAVLRNTSLGDPSYTNEQNSVERMAEGLRGRALVSHAQGALAPLEEVDRPAVIDAWKSGDTSKLGDDQLHALSNITSLSSKSDPLFERGEALSVVQAGPIEPGQVGDQDVLGGVVLNMRAGGFSEAKIVQHNGKVNPFQTVIELDSDIDSEITRLKVEGDKLREFIDKEPNLLSKIIPGRRMADDLTKSRLRKDLQAVEEKQFAYETDGGRRQYAIDQLNSILRKKPYIGLFGQSFSLSSAAGTAMQGLIGFGADTNAFLGRTDAAGLKVQAKVAGFVGAEGLEEEFSSLADRADQFARDAISQGEFLEGGIEGASTLAFRDNFGSNVAIGAIKNSIPFAFDVGLGAGTSMFARKVATTVTKKTLAELGKKGTLKYIDKLYAPLISVMPGAGREAVGQWMEGQRLGDSKLEAGGFDSLGDLTSEIDRIQSEGGDVADLEKLQTEVQGIFDGSQKAYWSTLATTAGTDMLSMGFMLGRANRSFKDVESQALGRLLGVGKETRLRRKVLEAFKGAAVEGATEGGQKILSNIGARAFYDKNKDIFEGVDVDTAVGAIMGVAANVAIEVNGVSKLRSFKRNEERARDRARRDASMVSKILNPEEDTADIESLPEGRRETGAISRSADESVRFISEQAGRMIQVDAEETSAFDPAAFEATRTVFEIEEANQAQRLLEEVAPTDSVEIDAPVEADTIDESQLEEIEVEVKLSEGVTVDDKGGFSVQRGDGKTESFDTSQGANDFADNQASSIRESEKSLSSEDIDAIAIRSLGVEADAKRDAEEAAQEANRQMVSESLQRDQIEAERRATDELTISDNAAKSITDRLNNGQKMVSQGVTEFSPDTFTSGAMGVLQSVPTETGVPAINAALGLKARGFWDWATSGSKNERSSAKTNNKILKGLRQYSLTGEAPIKGMNQEFQNIKELMESLYRGSANVNNVDLQSPESEAMNSIYLDNVRRRSSKELKQGEVAGNNQGFVRIPTKKGEAQKGFKEEAFAKSFMKRQKNFEADRLRLETDSDGSIFVVRPILTPAVQSAITSVKAVNNSEGILEVRQNGGPLLRTPPSVEDVKTAVDNRVGIMGVNMVKELVGKLPFVAAKAKESDNAIQDTIIRYNENTYIMANIAGSEIVLLAKAPYTTDENGFIDGVTAKGKQSTQENDVGESILRGEDNYNGVTSETRQYFQRQREVTKTMNQILTDEGVDIGFIQRFQSGRINWDQSGRPGHLVRAVNKFKGEELDTPSSRGLSPKLKSRLDRSRRLDEPDGARKGVELGIEYFSMDDAMAKYLRGSYQRIADHRFFNEEAVRSAEVVDPTDATLKDRGSIEKVGGSFRLFENEESAKAVKEAFESALSLTQGEGKLIEASQFGKALVAGFDYSSPWIFGHLQAFKNPDAWGKAVALSTEAFLRDDDAFTDYVSKIDNQSDFLISAAMGVQYSGRFDVIKGLEGEAFNRATLGVAGRFAKQHSNFLNASSLMMWQSMTKGILKKTADGNIHPEFQDQARQIADFINRSGGRFNFARHGFSKGKTTAARVAFYSAQMYAGFVSLYGSALKAGFSGDQARKALMGYALGTHMAFGAMALASGMDEDEMIARMNPITSGGKYLSVPFRYSKDAPPVEISIGGFTKAIIKLVAQTLGGTMGALEIGPEFMRNDLGMAQPTINFFTARRAPGVSTVIDFVNMTNFFGEPIPLEEVMINHLTPIPVQDLLKVGQKNLYTYLAENNAFGVGGYAARNRIYVNSDAGIDQTLMETMIQFGGLNVYTQSKSRSFSEAMEKMANQEFGKPYEELQTPEMARINSIIRERPEFKGEAEKMFNTNGVMKTFGGKMSPSMIKEAKFVTNHLSADNILLVNALELRIPPIARSFDDGQGQYNLNKKQRDKLKQSAVIEINIALDSLRDKEVWEGLSVAQKQFMAQDAVNVAKDRSESVVRGVKPE